ncbi:MAG TPA: Fe-S protein assembly chaperone HscA, partial [Polyangiaceae bacterium]|nr:Fe-S protein assembly chaperone HscA [Polyangiaceae bacterium]
ALGQDADLLAGTERTEIDAAIVRLRTAIGGTAPGAIQAALDALDAATHAWAGRRMNRAVEAAIAGRAVTEVARRVERAQGVEAHLAEHAGKVL